MNIGILVLYCTVILYSFAINTVNCELKSLNKTSRLLYLIPKEHEQSYTVSQKDTFTYKLLKGWVLEADKQFDLVLHVLDIQQNTNVDYSNVKFFFTNDQDDCLDNDKTPIYTAQLIKYSYNLLKFEAKVNLKHTNSKYFTCLSLNGVDYYHQGTDNVYTTIMTTSNLLPIYVVVFLYLILLCLSALFSGLNLGLMSLDLTELKLLKKIGLKKERYYAKRIYPLRKRGNFLLCTILLGNVLVNSSSTLILGSYLDGIFAAIGSTLFIVIFGEIIPQTVCSRYGLLVGTYTRHITYFFMGLTSPFSFPLSKVLDCILGKEMGSTCTRDKVRELMKQTQGLEEKEKKFISGALDFKNKTVADVMMPVNEVFKLDINAVLDFNTFQSIAFHGYSRVPIYEHTKENLIGMILVQDLLLNDPNDKLPLRSVAGFFKHKVAKCTVNDRLDTMFEKFRQGESHMAFVYEKVPTNTTDEINEALGIVTLEDVIEELVQMEIMDEMDFKRANRKKKVKEALRSKLKTPIAGANWNIFVNPNDEKPIISPQIRKALFCFLQTTVKPFTDTFMSHRVVEHACMKHSDFIIEKRNLTENNNESTDVYIYKYGQECDYFVIILDGYATMEIGKEKTLLKTGLFSYFGVHALVSDSIASATEAITEEADHKPYVPEFSLKVNEHCVYFQISRKDWINLVKKSNMERKFSVYNSNL